MKKEGVWDNTTVVLASDHSAGDDPAYSKIFTDAGMGTGAARSNALLLVKKAGQAGELKTDDALMTAGQGGRTLDGRRTSATAHPYFGQVSR